VRSHYFRRRAAFPLHFVVFFPFSLSGPQFAPFHSFTHILLSGTPIDAPSSPTRSTSKHLPIPTIYFNFKRSKCADLVILFFLSFWSFSYDPGLRLTISLRLYILEVSTFPSPPSFSVLNGRIDCFHFYVPCFCFMYFCFYFLLFHCMFWDASHT
jgi:hypothetical protein